MGRGFIEPRGCQQRIHGLVVHLGRERIQALGNAELVQGLVDPAEGKQEAQRVVKVRFGRTRVELNRAAKAPFGALPLRGAREGDSQCVMRFGQQRIQLDGLFGRGAHVDDLALHVEPELLGSGRVSLGKSGICRGKH
jgi:hypothetical protein